MTTPPGPPSGPPPGESPWSRPGGQVPPPARPVAPPSQSPTRQINLGGPGGEQPTGAITPPPAQSRPPVPPVPPAPPVGTGQRLRGFLKDPLSIVLVLVTVLALAVAGLVGAEVYARRVADSRVSEAASCEVRDGVQVSFGATPPVLWQHFHKHYSDIVIHTDGNNIRDAKQMTVDLNLQDITLDRTADSRGTIGSVDVLIDWKSDGIQQTVAALMGGIGSLAVSSVTPQPSDGTLKLKGMLSEIIVKPQVADGGFQLEVQKFSGLGVTIPRETIQAKLDDFTTKLTTGYPLGLKADSVAVTDEGVHARMTSQNATIPTSSNPCFANL